MYREAVFNCGLLFQAREARGIRTSPEGRKAMVDSVVGNLLAPRKAPLEELVSYLRIGTLKRIEEENGLPADEVGEAKVRKFIIYIELLRKLMR